MADKDCQLLVLLFCKRKIARQVFGIQHSAYQITFKYSQVEYYACYFCQNLCSFASFALYEIVKRKMMTFCRERDLQESQPQSYSSREVVGSLDPNSYSLVAIRANHFSMYHSSVPGDIINILKSKSPIRQERQLSDEIATCPLDF